MGQFHDENDDFNQLRRDGEPYGHTPDSVRESALEELGRRYPKDVVEAVRLGNLTPDGEK